MTWTTSHAPGARVRALTRIVEDDADPRADARPCEPGWTHAEPGDLGTVREDCLSVRWDRAGTTTRILAGEVELVGDA